jgi:acetyl esterase/lipase
MLLGKGRRPSLAMRTMAAVLRVRRGPTCSPEELRREYVGRKYPQHAPVSRSLRALADVVEDRVLGRTVYRLTPRAGASGWHIVYTHGGAFVHPLGGPNWAIVKQVMRATGATITVPIYPLAPEHEHSETFYLLEQIYRDLLQRVAPERIVLCGDSAGGNLALAQALHYRGQALPLPGRIILFSPWLDLTMSNPDAAVVERRDVMLRRAELIEWGRWWAGAEDPRDALLSPIFADLRGLPPVQIYQGMDDLFLPDARRLGERIEAAGGSVQLHETPGGFHVFMGATFTPEARAVFRRIGESLGTPARAA